MKNIRPIKKVSIGEQICDQIMELLVDGTWEIGEKIPSENQLAEAFGVSRITVREALLRLSALGLLETRFGSGTYVKEVTPTTLVNSIMPSVYIDSNSMLEVLEYRQVFEVKTAGLAARKATDEGIKELERIYADMVRNQDSLTDFAESDLEFHLALSTMTNNSMLIATMNVIKSALSVAMQQIIEYRGNDGGLADHAKLIESIRAHDEEETMRLMEEHISEAYATVEQLLIDNDKI